MKREYPLQEHVRVYLIYISFELIEFTVALEEFQILL